MGIINAMVLVVNNQGINWEFSPMDLLPEPYKSIPIKPVYNLNLNYKQHFSMVFYAVPEDTHMVSIKNNLLLKSGDSHRVKFTSQPIPMDPMVDKWCQQPFGLNYQYMQVIMRPVKSLGKSKGIISVQMAMTRKDDKYGRSKVIMSRGAVVVNGDYYDGEMIVNGEMDFLATNP